MYRVTKRKPNSIISQELWSSRLKALIRRDMINIGCDEYTGAIIEVVQIEDVESIVHRGNGLIVPTDSLYDCENVEFELNSEFQINFSMANNGDVSKGESDFKIYDIYFSENGNEYLKVEFHKETIQLLEDLVNETMQYSIDEYVKEEFLTR